MDNNEYIELFFSKSYEETLNKLIRDDRNYIIPYEQLNNYVRKVISIPYIDFIEYIRKNRLSSNIEANDITQSSSFSACEIEMCNALLWADNRGLNFVEIGKLFPQYVSHPNDSAYRKYGENQIKTSAHLGLAYEYYKFWYLSCLGYIYPNLDIDSRRRLLARTIIRNELYQQMLMDILDHDINPRFYMRTLSESTIKRRLNNVCMLFQICLDECGIHNISTNKIIDDKFKVKEISLKSTTIFPVSNKIATDKLNEIFLHTTASYKYFWFLSILQILGNNNDRIKVFDIIIRMIAYAWRPVLIYELSFGNNDSLKEIITEIQNKTKLPYDASFDEVVKRLTIKERESYVKRCLNILAKNVPYRFLNPWIDSPNNSILAALSHEYKNGCLYSIHRDVHVGSDIFFITINPDWIDYLIDNNDLLSNYTYEKLTNYLESKNPGVSDIINKINLSYKGNGSHDFYETSNTTTNEGNILINSEEIRYSLEGGTPLEKEKLILEIIKLYVSRHPDTSWEKLVYIFSNTLNKDSEYNIIEPLSLINIKSLDNPNIKSSFFMESNDLIKLNNGQKFVVNKKWKGDFEGFLKVAINYFKITLVYINKRNDANKKIRETLSSNSSMVGKKLKIFPSQQVGEVIRTKISSNGVNKLIIKVSNGKIVEIIDSPYYYEIIKSKGK